MNPAPASVDQDHPVQSDFVPKVPCPTLTEYSPTVKLGAVKKPLSFDRVVNTAFVSVLVTSTLAPTIAALLESVTGGRA